MPCHSTFFFLFPKVLWFPHSKLRDQKVSFSLAYDLWREHDMLLPCLPQQKLKSLFTSKLQVRHLINFCDHDSLMITTAVHQTDCWSPACKRDKRKALATSTRDLASTRCNSVSVSVVLPAIFHIDFLNEPAIPGQKAYSEGGLFKE
jgi:hypothetical protein